MKLSILFSSSENLLFIVSLLIWMLLLMSDRMLRMAGSEIAGELAGLLLEQSCLFGVFSLGFCFDLLFIVDSDGMAGLNEVQCLLFRLSYIIRHFVFLPLAPARPFRGPTYRQKRVSKLCT